MRATRLLVGTVLVVALVACGSDDDDGPPLRTLDTTAAPGFTVASDVKAGFAVSLPESWRQLPTELGRFDAVAEEVRQQSDKVSVSLARLKQAVRDGTALAAVDPATGSSVNLTILEADASLDDMAVAAGVRLRETGATDLVRESTTVDGLPAVRQRFRVLPAEAGDVVLQRSQFYVVRRGKAFILSLAGDSPDLDRIAGSLKLA